MFKKSKNSKIWVLIFSLWIIAAIILVTFPIEELSISMFLAVFWFYGIFNTTIVANSHFLNSEHPTSNKNSYNPKIAVLYCCYNDFNVSSLESLVGLSYHRKKIFILDDSTDHLVKKEVDRYSKKYQLTVLRRNVRRGWKAGAINDALEKIDADYIVISDSDEILPKDFVQRSLIYFDDSIVFVQTNHVCYSEDNEWVRLLGVGVNIHWDHYQDYRNKYGLVQILGHGVIIKTEVLKKIKFPELVSEDLALTLKLAQEGLRGYFAKDIVCGESFPRSYLAFRKRHKKWCQGSAELLKKMFPRFIISKNVTWFEKMDVLVATSNLPLTLMFPIFSIISYLLNPISFSNPIVIGLSLMTLISPLLPFHDLKLGWKRNIKVIVVNTIAYGSLLVLTITNVIKGFLKPSFLVTHEKTVKSFDLTLLTDCSIGLLLFTSLFPNVLGFCLLCIPILFYRYH